MARSGRANGNGGGIILGPGGKNYLKLSDIPGVGFWWAKWKNDTGIAGWIFGTMAFTGMVSVLWGNTAGQTIGNILGLPGRLIGAEPTSIWFGPARGWRNLLGLQITGDYTEGLL